MKTFVIFFALLSGTLLAQTPRIPAHFIRERGVTRARPSALAAAQFGANNSQGQTVRMDFFADAQFNVTLDRVENQGADLAWSGHIEGMDRSSATFVVSGNYITGSVNPGNGRIYQIRTADDGMQWALEIDQSRFPKDEADSVPAIPAVPAANPGLSARDVPTAADDGATIDVLVLWTPAARVAAGGLTQIQQLVQLGIAETNTAYSNSGIVQRVRLVDSEELNYTESTGGIAKDLLQIATSPTVAALRDKYGADVVSLWVSTSESACGIGYLLADPTFSPSSLAPYGFSVAELDCATGYYTFGHEMGHNMGAAHAKDDLNPDGSVPAGAYAYSNGYKQTIGTDRFRTVMAYDCNPSCVRIQYFSNPAVTYHSMPVGIDPNSPLSADNALTLNNTRTIVANFRASIGGSTGGPTGQAPVLTITTKSQTVSTASITISGTATDAGQGNNGISSVTVNGVPADNGTATGAGVASWSLNVTLLPGANLITVVAKDNSTALNSTTATVTITLFATSSVPAVTANTYHIFPQFADGFLGDHSYFKTTVMISNPSGTTGANCSLQLHGVTLPGFSLSYNMAPNGWVIAATSGQGPYQSGYATLQCTFAVEAQLLYSFYTSSGAKISEATVFSSPAAASVQVLADERENAKLGFALANDSDQTVTYTVTITGAGVLGNGSITLGPRSASAQFVDDVVPGVPPGVLGQVLVSSSTGKASIIGLRFTGGVFTTIPQTLAGSVGTTSNSDHVFPEIADGKFADGSYFRTTRIYSNPIATAGTSCATLLHGMTIGGQSVFIGGLGPGTFAALPTAGTQALQSGYAEMQCSLPVDAAALYSFYSANGVKMSEATVFSSPPGLILQILSDSREGAQVGLAIANNTDQPNTYMITVYDAGGSVVGTATQNLPARSSIARFVNEFVPLPPNHYGPVIVSGTGAANIIGLRFTGSTFTTIPGTVLLAAPVNPPPAVTVTRAYTTDTNNVVQNTFTAGQPIRLTLDVNNSLSTPVAIGGYYQVIGAYFVGGGGYSGSSVPAGANTVHFDLIIPQSLPDTYILNGFVISQGAISSKSATFTVTK
jgi:hypothetical protein